MHRVTFTALLIVTLLSFAISLGIYVTVLSKHVTVETSTAPKEAKRNPQEPSSTVFEVPVQEITNSEFVQNVKIDDDVTRCNYDSSEFSTDSLSVREMQSTSMVIWPSRRECIY